MHDGYLVKEGNLHKWFSKSKSKDGKKGWVNVVTGGTCASDKPGEGTPKCVSSAKRASMTKAERLSAQRRKKKADPNQQSKSGAAKPTYVKTDKPKKKMKEATIWWSQKALDQLDALKMAEAKVDQGKDDYAKMNDRNQRTFGNRRDSKKSNQKYDDTEARRYNTEKGRGVKIRGKKDKTPVNYHKRDSEKRVDALLKSMRESMSGGVPMTPQELNIQKKMSQLNVRLARKRSQQLQKAKVQDTETSPEQVKEEGLRAWFGKSSGTTKSGRKVKGWVQVGGKYDGKPCARQPGQKTTPKCVSSSKRRSMSDKERDSAARRKRAADPGQPQKTGAAKPTMVSTDPKK